MARPERRSRTGTALQPAEPIWSPSPARIAASRLALFMKRVGAADYPSLHRWSVDEPQAFWTAVWRFAAVKARREPDRVVDDLDRMPGARWFPGARLNFAENLLRYGDSREAVVYRGEDGTQNIDDLPRSPA